MNLPQNFGEKLLSQLPKKKKDYFLELIRWLYTTTRENPTKQPWAFYCWKQLGPTKIKVTDTLSMTFDQLICVVDPTWRATGVALDTASNTYVIEYDRSPSLEMIIKAVLFTECYSRRKFMSNILKEVEAYYNGLNSGQ